MPEELLKKKKSIKSVQEYDPFITKVGTLVAKNKVEAPIYIWRYKTRSRSARSLMKALEGVQNIQELIYYNKGPIVINWGHSGSIVEHFAQIKPTRIINDPKSIAITRNKLKFFNACKKADKGPRIPVVYENVKDAVEAVRAGAVLFGRSFTGSCGTDIVTYEEDPGEFQKSDFWTEYKKKAHEFRIHIFRKADGYVVIDKQQKVLRKTDPTTGEPIDRSKVNFMIRNHSNGFIFQRNDIDVPDDVIQQAIRAIEITNLDFGAIDVIWNEYEKKAYVLEINTAPGLEGTTLDNYVSTFKEVIGL